MARMLIVEDEHVIRVALQRLLQRHGHQVVIAGSLHKARRALASGAFDLVVADLQLPDGLGTDIIPERPTLPVLIMTSYTSGASRLDAMNKGAADYIAKPFDHGDMLARIGRILGDAMPQQATPAS